MRLTKVSLFLFFCCQLYWGSATAESIQPVLEDSLDLPVVFIIGEHEAEFNSLSLEHETLLLTACNDDMDFAYDKWLAMLKEMEAYSNIKNFDLKGVKMWINIFWEKDGTISNIAYYLKPQSRNIDTRYLTAFLTQFAREHRFSLVYDEKYSHYGTANFPVLPRRLGAGVSPVSSGSLQNVDNKQLVKDRN